MNELMPGAGVRIAVCARVLAVTIVALASACTPPPPPPTPPVPPKAFLTIPTTTVVAPTIKGSVTTMGCKKVGQVQILESNNFVMDARYSGEPTSFEIAPALFNSLFPKRGFATSLSLTAKVVCEDVNTLTDGGFTVREGVSQPVSVQFLPVDSVRTDQGKQALPDTFVAEGGIGGQPTTFIGCVGTQTGTALLRIDQNGNALAVNQTLPFDCNFASIITDKNTFSGTRWLWIPQRGAFAFDGNLNITSSFEGAIDRFSVSPIDGDAVAGLDDHMGGTRLQFVRLKTRLMQGEQAQLWTTLTGPLDTGYPGSFCSDPLIEPGMRRMYTCSWQYRMTDGKGAIVVLVYNYDNAQFLNSPPPAILSFDFGTPLNRPIPPTAAFKEDGTLIYAPLLTVDRQSGDLSTTVLACPSTTPGCQTSVRRWTSPTFQGELTTIVGFSRGNFVAAVGPFATYFLGANDGVVKNLGGTEPLRPTGSLVTQGLVTGKGSDVYLLNGAIAAPNQLTFPTEVIATDHPASGELWKLAIQGGTHPADSIYLAIDDNGQAWMRVGVDQVRPLGLAQYREKRGATTPP